MSKRESISRYNLIIKKLRKQPSSFQQIADYLAMESELQAYNFNVSKRTFHRDIEDIQSIYNIDIRYNKTEKLYYIDVEHQPDMNSRIMEAYDIFNALNITDRLANYIHFEKRKPQGTENLYGLLHAIKNLLQITFSYQKYGQDEATLRTVDPYALKEFKNRWYVVAKDNKDNQIKSFSIDRLTELSISRKKIHIPYNFNVNTHFRDCFGITGPNGHEPKEIILSFTPIQGKYIKSLPLHESQQIILDNDKELRIKLHLIVNHDFFMELLSMGHNVKVLEPASLVQELKSNLQKTLKQYQGFR